MSEKQAGEKPAEAGTQSGSRASNFLGGLKSKAHNIQGVNCYVENWRSHRLSTLQVFTFTSGTVLAHPVLWVEQFLTCLIYTVILGIICYARPSWYTKEWADTTGGNLQSFTTLLSSLAGFLLSFYVAACINRWWDLRINGIQAVWNASSELTMFLSRCVTNDQMALDAVGRYVRASLLLLVMQHKPYCDSLSQLKSSKLLTDDELDKLQNMTNVPESIWTWITHIIVMLHKKGKIGPGPFYCFLLGLADSGREGAARIGSTLSTPIPLIYVHLLCLMVKVHNFLLAVLMAIVSASFFLNGMYFLFFQALGRMFLLPIFYNGILLICETLSDPFSGELGDFPLQEYLDQMSQQAQGYIAAGDNIPDWIQERKHATAAKAAAATQ